MSDVDVEELVSAYLSIRSERDRISKEYEAADALLKADMAEIEGMMMDVCTKMNINSINTKMGTVIRKTNERYVCNDWDGFRKFVLENQAVELLEKRIHQGCFKEYLETNSGDGLPPGINVMREFVINVRKSSK